MELTKDCPLCGEKMRRKAREEISLVPGTSETKATKVREWICPDCDYFEEIEEEEEAPR
jgi:acetone carboxylase gamma subunit